MAVIRLSLVQPRFAVFIVFQAPTCMSEHRVECQCHGVVFLLAGSWQSVDLTPREVRLQFMPFNGNFSQLPKNNLDTLWLERQHVLRHEGKGRGFGPFLQRPGISYFCKAKLKKTMGNTTPTPTVPY